MQRRLMMLSFMLGVIGAGVPLGGAQAQTCQELWAERNAYYNALGYCFKTTRAIKYFGKTGCSIESEDSLRFSPPIRTRVNRIRDKEREVGCSANSPRGPALADATCNQLWIERNAYYKTNGYCFQ